MRTILREVVPRTSESSTTMTRRIFSASITQVASCRLVALSMVQAAAVPGVTAASGKAGGVAGLGVAVSVGVSVGVEVDVDVGVKVGVKVAVLVGVSVGVDVGV